jgi:hypothetical protein
MVRGLAAGGKWIRTISTRKRTDFCRLHNGPRSRNGSTSFATGDRQVHGNHAARPPLAHREPPQTRYCNPLRGARGQQGEAAAGFGSGVKRLLADAMPTASLGKNTSAMIVWLGQGDETTSSCQLDPQYAPVREVNYPAAASLMAAWKPDFRVHLFFSPGFLTMSCRQRCAG